MLEEIQFTMKRRAVVEKRNHHMGKFLAISATSPDGVKKFHWEKNINESNLSDVRQQNDCVCGKFHLVPARPVRIIGDVGHARMCLDVIRKHK